MVDNIWTDALPTTLKEGMLYLPGIGYISGGMPERGIGSAAGTYAGTAAASAGLLGGLGALGGPIGGIVGAALGGLFENKDPDKYLWAEPVRRLTGNNPDGWGSGGDWSAWIQQRGIDKGTADHYGAMIRQKQIDPDTALAKLGIHPEGRTIGQARGQEASLSASGGGIGGNRVLPTTEEMFGKGGMAYIPDIELPEFQRPEKFDKIQNQLQGIATDIMNGTPSEYFAPIGEFGGKLFEDVISGITADVTRAAQASEVARGMGRGGVGAVPEAVAKTVAPLRYEDYARAIAGRERLMGYGTDVLSNVRQAEAAMSQLEGQLGLQRAGMKSEYDLGKAGLISQYELGSFQAEEAAKAAQKRLDLMSEQIRNQYELGLISADQAAEQLAFNRQKYSDALSMQQEQAEGSFWGDILDIGITGLTGGLFSGGSSGGNWFTNLFGSGTTDATSNIVQGQIANTVSSDAIWSPTSATSAYYQQQPTYSQLYGKPLLATPTYA